jgi:heme/copper-type cytochrome/quinol oxidase subunit 3
MMDRLEGIDRVETHKLGMLLFIASEAIFFALLIFAYLYFRDRWLGGEGPTAEVLDVGLTAIFTVLLLASSVTIWLAERSLRHGKPGGMRAWLLVTILLGTAFLIGQGSEYATLIREGVTISTNLFGSTFYTLTGFHGFHVLIGLVMLAIVWGLGFRGRRSGAGGQGLRSNEPAPSPHPPAHHSVALETVSLYWHFVDVVWIVVFSVVYLWALFL